MSTTVTFAHMAMGRISAAFVSRYPGVELEVTADDRFIDLVAEGFDVAIRIGPRPEHDLVGYCFLRDQMLVVAPNSLPHPSVEDAMASSIPAVVLTTAPDAPVWRAVAHGKDHVFHPRPILRLSSPSMIFEAARAGAGAALLPQSMVAGDLAAGRLVLWGEVPDLKTELWVLHTSRRLVSPKVAAFVHFLRAAYSEGAVLHSLFYSPWAACGLQMP